MRRLVAVLFTVVLCTFILISSVNAKNLDSIKRKTVVLDPGHGGHDIGAKGLNGSFEKGVTLKLANLIAAELKKTYNVVLTRSDDYWLDSHARTATANHSKADLFISIHTGGSFRRQANKTDLYYYRPIADQKFEPGNLQNRSSSDRNMQTDWRHTNNRHQAASRLLANLVGQGLNKNTVLANSEIKGAPIMVLEGADMPAILIEVGYITNPSIEKSLNDSSVLSSIVKGIKRGIDDFFESTRQNVISE